LQVNAALTSPVSDAETGPDVHGALVIFSIATPCAGTAAAV